MTSHVLDSKKPFGELLLVHVWSERNGGYQDEEITDIKLTVSEEGTILMTERSDSSGFGKGRTVSEEVYEISAGDLIKAIKEKGAHKGTSRII